MVRVVHVLTIVDTSLVHSPRHPSVSCSREKPCLTWHHVRASSRSSPQHPLCCPAFDLTSSRPQHPHPISKLPCTRSHAHVAQRSECSPARVTGSSPTTPSTRKHVGSAPSTTEHAPWHSLLASARPVPRSPTASHSLNPRGTTPVHPTGGQPAPLQLRLSLPSTPKGQHSRG